MANWPFAALICTLLLPLPARSQAPSFPPQFSGHARFETTEGFRERGWANLVAARRGAEPCILSVRRLLGPEGGFSRQASVAEAPAFVRHIKIDSFSGGSQGYIVGGVPIPSPEVAPAQPDSQRIAARPLRRAGDNRPGRWRNGMAHDESR